MPFEKQVAFFGAFYELQKDSLKVLLDSWRNYVEQVPLDHHAECDGCGQQPIVGLRFKCIQCADYDLCSKCFLQKHDIHAGECKDHEFALIPLDPGTCNVDLCQAWKE